MKTKNINDHPTIEIVNATEHEDGSATYEFVTNDAFDQMYLQDTGKKRVTKKGLSKYILDLIKKAVNRIDGYDIEEKI